QGRGSYCHRGDLLSAARCRGRVGRAGAGRAVPVRVAQRPGHGGPAVTPHRSGAALVLAVFVLMALGTTSLGLLYVSTQEVLIARAGEESKRARWAAESAVRATLANWSTRRVLSLDPGDEMDIDAGKGGVRVTIVRLGGSLYLITATTRGVARGSAAALVRTVRPEAL